MQIIKEPKEYAQEVKNLGFTKIEFFEHMLDNKYDIGCMPPIVACNWSTYVIDNW